MADFTQRLEHAVRRTGSVLCVGIDPDLERLPPDVKKSGDAVEAVRMFCSEVIPATADFAVAFKFNFAFFEALGWRGARLLEELVAIVPDDCLTIADAKRGDIGNTARMYASAIFDRMKFDACTVSPYMGRDSVEPFLEFEGTCTFVLARTSNAGGNDLQLLECGSRPLYQHVAESVHRWASAHSATAGLVVGATDIEALAELRAAHPQTPFLIPGVGAQGGSAADVMAAAGRGPLIVNSSRKILYASSAPDFARAARTAAEATATELRAPS
jgi:orotidine-5'-phosphate decarboxylase